MSRKPPVKDVDENDLEVTGVAHAAAGATAVAVAMKRAVEQMGVRRTARTLLRLNQVDGFDCQGCAWPDPDPEHRHTAEFCENGAKAVTEEATLRHLDRAFFAAHPMADLADKTDYWLGQQGRLTEPMVLRAGGTHYEPISWDDAFAMVGGHLRRLASPDEAVFYTSGKTSNEAAFAYQLFARAFGTNNLPDCSNMCHESTSVALAETIGIGKGSVTLDDVHHAELIVIARPEPRHQPPADAERARAREEERRQDRVGQPAARGGAGAVQEPADAARVGRRRYSAGRPAPPDPDQRRPGAVPGARLAAPVSGTPSTTTSSPTTRWASRRGAEHIAEVDWEVVERASGLARQDIEETALMLRDSRATVLCWAMGITQHRNSVATIKEIVNVALLQGNIGKPGAGLCPVRGHSNVQGDRTMGIWERPKPAFLDALQREFGFDPPREHGFDTVEAVKALADGRARVFFGMGGNFVSAVSDTEVTEDAMRRADLTVHVSTKLNRSHVVTGREALILPALGRSERDLTGGREQRVTVEDSMSAVHSSKGPLKPASTHLRSEVDIVCSLAEATLGDAHGLPWAEYRADYGRIRRSIANVVPGCAAYDDKVDQPGGFVLPHPPRDSRDFPTDAGKAVFSVSPIDVLDVPEGRLLLQTLRSHDQFNTTIYGLDDRYRGVKGGRRVVFVHPEDIAHLGWSDGDVVDLVSEWHDGSERAAVEFRIVSYDQPRGCAAAYYPETNPLIPLDSKAEGSNTPTSKSVIVRLERPGGRHNGVIRRAETDHETGHKRATDPIHQS